jgi:hypothetical protein
MTRSRQKDRGASPAFPSRLNLAHRRYHARDVHPQVTNALLHLGLARRASRRREARRAQAEYAQSLRCWRRANAEQTGRWREEVHLVAREYVALAAAEPGRGD